MLFSGTMVRAVLEGRKTQTRRVLASKHPASLFNGQWSDGYVLDPGNADWRQRDVRYAVGDRLWVREAWRVPAQDDKTAPRNLDRQIIGYEADCAPGQISATGKLRPGMFMPRWASRLTLIVTVVRVQRLQDISDADAVAEGIECVDKPEGDFVGSWSMYGDEPKDGFGGAWSSPVRSYRTLWDSLNGKRPGCAWSDNPWVVAVSFTVHRANIAAMPAREAA